MLAVARFTLAAALALLVALGTACSRPAPDATPEGAVRLWLEKMEAQPEDPRASREAFQKMNLDLPDLQKLPPRRAVA